MLESVLQRRNASIKLKITVKTLVALGIVVLAVGLPQLVHLAAGASAGVTWLPMYLPVLLGGCMLGAWWGLAIGISAPTVSFLFTLALGEPMPTAARLPFMIAELAVFAVVSGLFSERIAKNGWMAFPAVILAAVAGRATFMLLVLAFQKVSALSPAVVWAQIRTGMLAVVLQSVIVPAIVMGLNLLLAKDGK